jgi:hypothetical protein
LFLHGLLHLEQGIAGTGSGATQRRGVRKQAEHPQQIDLAAQEAPRVQALEQENRRLKMLLAESMLELAAFKERG